MQNCSVLHLTALQFLHFNWQHFSTSIRIYWAYGFYHSVLVEVSSNKTCSIMHYAGVMVCGSLWVLVLFCWTVTTLTKHIILASLEYSSKKLPSPNHRSSNNEFLVRGLSTEHRECSPDQQRHLCHSQVQHTCLLQCMFYWCFPSQQTWLMGQHHTEQ